MSELPSVVLVGRQNVGKSTLFNRLTQSRRAMTSDVPGTTRDWLRGQVQWGDKNFELIDTGGYGPGEDDVMRSVREIVEDWIRQAAVVVWVVDGKDGLTADDKDMARRLRPLSKKIIVTVNKCDNEKEENNLADFLRMGFKDLIAISSISGRHINDLLDRIESYLPAKNEKPEEFKGIRVAMVGRPNVGKSSLVNQILGQFRVIVSDVAGTTRETIDTPFEANGQSFVLMDTAGLRTKRSKAIGLESLSRIMSEKALERCDVALLLVDGKEGLLDGDTQVARMVHENNRAMVIAVNKWDLVSDRSYATTWFKENTSINMPFAARAPLIFISAKTGEHVPELLKLIAETYQQFTRQFDSEEVEAFLWSEIANRPYSFNGKKLVFKGARQVSTSPPTFSVRANLEKEQIHFSFLRRLENAFCEKYTVRGTPVVFHFHK
jgi:GTP-binding protein